MVKFHRIPEEYVIKNADTDKEIALKVEHFAGDGSSKVSYITANVYRYENNEYLIDQKVLSEGDYIQLEDSAKRIQVQEKNLETLHGVYNINKGYAVFRRIDVIYQTEEYAIIRSGTEYGVSLYDHIALDGSTVTENVIINK